MKVVNFVQDVPTPHNNAFVRAVERSSNVIFKLWFAEETHSQYDFSRELAHEIKESLIFGSNWPSLGLLRAALRKKEEIFLIVGWANPTTRLIVLLFFVTRCKYFVWFDFPNDDAVRGYLRNLLRELYYWILKHSRAKVFCAGKATLTYFVDRGFGRERLTNLPIFTDTLSGNEPISDSKRVIRNKYGAAGSKFFLTCGSRLIHDKGYDLLIRAVKALPQKVKTNVKVLIVGKGDAKSTLVELCHSYGLAKNIFFADWMPVDDFKACVSASDLFVHPARFDAFGGGPLIAMSLGIPVVGTRQAGACRELIRHGQNGLLYESIDVSDLAEKIIWCHDHRVEVLEMGRQARKDMMLHASNVVKTFVTTIVKEFQSPEGCC